MSDDSLLRARDALNERLEDLAESRNAVDCVAQGKLEVALAAIEAAANLLGEDEHWVAVEVAADTAGARADRPAELPGAQLAAELLAALDSEKS